MRYTNRHFTYLLTYLLSDEGAQQGDPLGPLWFCLTTKRLTQNISSELNLRFLDDGSVGGDHLICDLAAGS